MRWVTSQAPTEDIELRRSQSCLRWCNQLSQLSKTLFVDTDLYVGGKICWIEEWITKIFQLFLTVSKDKVIREAFENGGDWEIQTMPRKETVQD